MSPNERLQIDAALPRDQLVIDGERLLLKCLNHAYDEIVEIPGLDAIHGVITQKSGTRRKDRKRYD